MARDQSFIRNVLSCKIKIYLARVNFFIDIRYFAFLILK